MKRKIIILLITLQSIVAGSQTKKETYDYISNKLLAYALNDAEVTYKYSIGELKNTTKPYIIIVEKCSAYGSMACTFSPKDFNYLTVKNNTSNKWLIINCKSNSIEEFDISSTGKPEKFSTSSSFEFILDKDIPKEEIERLKKAFAHLFKLYGVEKKELFD